MTMRGRIRNDDEVKEFGMTMRGRIRNDDGEEDFGMTMERKNSE